MADLDLTYWLPVSALRLTGTRSVVTDSVRGCDLRTWRSAAELVVVADQAGSTRTARITAGAFRNTNAVLGFTADGRLTAASAVSSGAAVPLVKGLVTAGATLAGLVVGSPGTALLGARRGTTLAEALSILASDGLGSVEAQPEPEVPEDPVLAAYEQAHRPAAYLLQLAADRAIRAEVGLSAALERAVEAPSRATRREVGLHEEVLRLAQSDLTRRRQHFDVWRGTTITTRTTEHERLLTFDELAAWDPAFDADGSSLDWGPAGPPELAQEIWDELGILPIEAQDGTLPPTATEEGQITGTGVTVRRPRRARLLLYRRVSGDVGWRAELLSTQVHDIVDSRCRLTWVPFRTSMLSKRETAIDLDDGGTLSRFTHTTTGSSEAIGGALSELPTSLVDGLQQAQAMRERVAALQDTDREHELARVRREVEIKKQQLELAGLTATEADFAELRRLEQRAALLEQRRNVALAEAPVDESREALGHPPGPVDAAQHGHDDG